jgi:hypothetical protein
MMNDRGDVIDVRALLTIDVDSELRKLSGAQLQGPWQIPAEAVRRALRSGAREVDVRLGRHQATIVDDGAGIPGQALQWTAILLDRHRSAEERHAALTALESCGELVLLAVAGLPCRTLRIESTHEGHRWTLEVHRGKRPTLSSDRGHAARGCEMTLVSSELDRRQCSEWVSNAARFAHATVRVDGKPISHGFEQALATKILRSPLQGAVAVTLDAETAHVWLLEHGLITGHVTIPDALPFEAAIELGSDATDLSAARVRDSFSPHAGILIDQAVTLLVELGERGPSMSELMRARVARLVLQAARKRLRLEEVVTVPAFRALENGTRRLINLVALRRSAQRDPSGVHVLTALYPSQKPDHFALGTSPVLIADPIERSRLAELLSMRFRPPDPREASNSLGSLLRRWIGRSTRALARSLELLRHPIRRPPVADTILRPEEQALVRALRIALSDVIEGIDMCSGKGPIRSIRNPRPRLLLPRDNLAVRSAVATHARDPAWVYPIALTLLAGRELPPRSLRQQWLKRVASSPHAGALSAGFDAQA